VSGARLDSNGLGQRGRLAAGVVVGVVSIAVGTAAALVSRIEWRTDALVLPWGLVLAVAASGATVLLGRSVSRGTGFLAAAGWVVGAAILVLGRPEGDYVIASDYLGYGFLLCATGVVVVTAGYGGAVL